MPKLRVINGPRRDQEVTFERKLLLGRGDRADLDLADPTVSRRHARIVSGDSGFAVADLRSGNGTYVNGRRISAPVALGNGDELQLGEIRLEFQETAEQGEERRPRPSGQTTGRILLSEDPDFERSAVLSLDDDQEDLGQLTDGAEIEVLRSRLRLVREVTGAIARILDEGELLDHLLETVLETFPHADRTFVVLAQEVEVEGEVLLSAARSRMGEDDDIRASRTLLRETLRSRKAILSVDASGDPALRSRTVEQIGIRSVLCVPLMAGGEIFGVLQADNLGGKRPFSALDLAVVSTLANSAALGLSHARLHERLLEQEIRERDLMLARQIQRRFLIEPPDRFPGYRFAAEYSPAQAVGGDLYAFLPLSGDRLGVAVGDVSGKGVSAALMMARIMSDLRYLAGRGASPQEVLRELNRSVEISGSPEGVFATLLFLRLRVETGRVEIVTAGHTGPLLRSQSGAEEVELPEHPALGLQSRARFSSFELTLEPGEGLLLFSDGLVEAADPAGRRFGIERAKRALERTGESRESPLRSVLGSAAEFTGSRGFDDDLTVVWIEREGDRAAGRRGSRTQ